MRAFLAALLLWLCAFPAAADNRPDDRYPVATMARDVTETLRACDRNPKACKVRRQQRRSRASPALLAMIDAAAKVEGIATELALALVWTESGYDPRRRGRAGEWGLTQIKCQTAHGLGFAGPCAALADAAINLKWGLHHAALALKRGSIGFHQAGLGARHVSRRYVQLINAAMR